MISEYPLVSIITPSYNQAAYIDVTIRSVLGQNYPNVEHIIVDGCSTDGTLDILRKYEPRLRWISARDDGQADAVNKGFALARGEILAWINSDDFYFSPDVVKHVIDVFNANPNVYLVYGGYAYVDQAGRLLQVRIPPNFNFNRLRRLPYIQNSNAFFRRPVIERHQIDIGYHYLLDTEFFLRVARDYPGLCTHEVLACFRIHDQQQTQVLRSDLKADERKRRDTAHSIRVDARFILSQTFDRILFKLLSWCGEYKIRRRWGKNLPYQPFLTERPESSHDSNI